MKKYYLALLVSSIVVFVLGTGLHGIFVDSFFTPKFFGYAIALLIYIIVEDVICVIVMYKTQITIKKMTAEIEEL